MVLKLFFLFRHMYRTSNFIYLKLGLFFSAIHHQCLLQSCFSVPFLLLYAMTEIWALLYVVSPSFSLGDVRLPQLDGSMAHTLLSCRLGRHYQEGGEKEQETEDGQKR